MDAYTKASRAVIAAYAKKTLRPIEVVAIIVLVVGLIGTAWLISNVSGWWWLLMIIVIAYGFIGSLIWLVIRFTLDRLRPEQTVLQKKAVEQFLEKFDKIAETVGMTKFGFLLRVIGDVMRRREQNVLSEFTQDSSKLKTSFESVIDAFRS